LNLDLTTLSETQKRWRDRTVERERNIRLMEQGLTLEIDSPARVSKFLRQRGYSAEEAARIASDPSGRKSEIEAIAGLGELGLERILGASDLLGVAFLRRGIRVARSVGRVWVGGASGRALGYGTGFMIAPHLLMTNNHVLRDAQMVAGSIVEFDYELDATGAFLNSYQFGLAPEVFFVTSKPLDYSIVAVRGVGSGSRQLNLYGWCPLIEEEGKAIISQWMNIIQHPSGEPKQIAFRANQLIDVLPQHLHYHTDTAQGSSGSPVFNDKWEVVGLHHSGVWATNDKGDILTLDGKTPWKQGMPESQIKWIANEGVRISVIMADVRQQLAGESAQKRALFESTTTMPPASSISREDVRMSDGQRILIGAGDGGGGGVDVTIPLTISVRLGDRGGGGYGGGGPAAAPAAPAPAAPPGPVSAMSSKDPSEEARLGRARQAFRRYEGVTGVRMGYVFRSGWITDQPAIVVTVRDKMNPEALKRSGKAVLPSEFEGIRVEITTPTLEELLAERVGPEVLESLTPRVALDPNEIKYFPPNTPLKRVKNKMKVIAHLSPDHGWETLKRFLEDTKQSLSVAMFDFGAPHILETLKTIGSKQAFKELKLVMQPSESLGSGTKKDDLPDVEVVSQLENMLGPKFEVTWVKRGSVNGWVSSSYHIKVAVRDGSAFWLSSGNWQSSNQPPVTPQQDPSLLDRYNREWHAIIEDKELAGMMEKYVLHDFQNGDVQSEEVFLPDLLMPEVRRRPSLVEAQRQYFPRFEDDREFDVEPLLTPDNYHDVVMNLIRSAKSELLIQNQTFNAPKPDHAKLKALIDLVIEKQNKDKIPVKIIFRKFMPSSTRANLEALKRMGIKTSSIRVQEHCHTKGIVVDRQKVLLGSQNWSNDGVSVNRDASLLFHDTKLAEYFADIFNHDWAFMTEQEIGSEWLPVELATPSSRTGSGYVRLSWKDYVELL